MCSEVAFTYYTMVHSLLPRTICRDLRFGRGVVLTRRCVLSLPCPILRDYFFFARIRRRPSQSRIQVPRISQTRIKVANSYVRIIGTLGRWIPTVPYLSFSHLASILLPARCREFVLTRIFPFRPFFISLYLLFFYFLLFLFSFRAYVILYLFR